MFKSKPRPTFQEKIRVGEHTSSMFELFVEIVEIPQSQSIVEVGEGKGEDEFTSFPLTHIYYLQEKMHVTTELMRHN
jgi:hypothetical protein